MTVTTSRKLATLTLCCLFAAACGPDENNAQTADQGTTPMIDMTVDSGPDGSDADMGPVVEDSSPDLPAEDSSPDLLGEDMAPDMDMEEMLPKGIPGLSASVSIKYDAQRVPHIRCQTNDDCHAALGYLHAQDRFAQMDLRRRVGTGRLSSMLRVDNEQALSSDISNRQLNSTRDGEPLEQAMYDALAAPEKAALDAYARGVNAWLDDLRNKRNGAALSEEAKFPVIDLRTIPAWEPQDSLAVGLVFLGSLMNIARSEINAGSAAALFDQNLFLDMYLSWHLDPDSPVITSAGETYDALGSLTAFTNAPAAPRIEPLRPRLQRAQPALEAAGSRLDHLDLLTAGEFFGSNSWATAPQKNQEDYALLANDPHLSLSNPALWYLAEMDAKSNGSGDLHAAGVTFPGMPAVLIGYSEEVAWSATVACWDLVDVYMEELSADGQGVMRDGQVVPFLKKPTTFKQATQDTEVELLYVPDHGPVLSIDQQNKTAISMKSVLVGAASDFDLFLNMGRTQSLADAKALLSKSTAAGFSFTLIDRQGNIAYYPFAGIPRREWDTTAHPAWLPLPGDGSYEWSPTLIRADELPQLDNPPAGFIATANGAITDDMLDGIPGNAGYPPLQASSTADGARQARIVDLLQASDAHTADSHAAMQGDTTPWLAQELVPELLLAIDGEALTPQAEGLKDILTSWDRSCPTGLDGSDADMAMVDATQAEAAIGCSAFHVLLFTLTAQTFQDELRAQGSARIPSYEYRAMYWLLKDPTKLANGEAYWDDVATMDVVESKGAQVVRAMETTLTHLEMLFGSDMSQDWLWGRIHTVTLYADLLSGLTPNFNNGPYAAPGGLETINVGDPADPGAGAGDYDFGAGPSMRMVVEGKPEGFTGKFNFPGGQVHRRDDAHYDDLLQGWLDNERFTMPFTPAEVDAASVEEETLVVR